MIENSTLTLSKNTNEYHSADLAKKDIYGQATETRNHWKSLIFEYLISAQFYRQHSNPPLWTDYHYHNFQVTLTLTSPCNKADLYGVDMIEAQKILEAVCEQIPSKVNELPECINGTTEQLCLYFASQVRFKDPQVQIKSVSVSETPERVTKISFA